MKNSVILFSLFFFFSCTKFGKNLYISGRVINPVTNQGIPNIEVKLLKGKGGLPGGWTGVKSVHTDENGRFEISHLGGTSDYVASVRAPSSLYQLGWLTGSGYNLQDFGLEVGKKYNVDFHAVPYSNAKFILNNINCQGSTDTLILYQSNQINSMNGNFAWEHVGCVYWESNGFSTIPMGSVYYKWIVKRSAITNTYYDTVYYDAGEYKTYIIEY